MTGLLRRTFWVCLAVLTIAVTTGATAADACPFCNGQGETLVSEAAQADLILFGRLTNAKEAKGGADTDGTTELHIDAVVKDHPFRGGKNVLVLPRYLPDTGGDKYKFLVFCTVFKGKLDPYLGRAVPADSDIAKYLKGALALQKAPIDKRLRFAFDYLDNADTEVSTDAYKEFSNADYKDYAPIAKALPAEKIAGWLKDREHTPAFRFGLYGSMLGHCGTAKHAALLHDMISDPETRSGSGVDGMLAGYIMLKPKEGWEFTKAVLGDPKTDFMFRYACLRAARFFYDTRTDLIKHDELASGVEQMITHPDIADLAIEDLRKWKRVEMADRILGLKDKRVFGLYHQRAFDTPIVRRAILRYALSMKGNEACAAYVEEQRKVNPAAVKDAEELLQLEQLPSK